MVDKVTTAKRTTKDFYSPEHRNITSHQRGFGFPPKQNHQSWNKIHFKAVRLEVGLQMLKYYFIKWPEITSVWVSLKLAKHRTVGRISERQESERSEVGDQEGKTKQAQSCDGLAPQTVWRTSCFHRYSRVQRPSLNTESKMPAVIKLHSKYPVVFYTLIYTLIFLLDDI